MVFWIALIGAGLVNGLIFGVMLLKAWQQKPLHRYQLPLGLLIIVAALAIFSMSLLNTSWAQNVETALTFAAGPLLLWTLLELLTHSYPIRWIGLTSIAAVVFAFSQHHLQPLSMSVLAQWMFTLSGWLVLFLSFRNEAQHRHEKRIIISATLLIVLTLIHGLQGYRIFSVSQPDAISWVIPLSIALAIVMVSALGKRLPHWLEKGGLLTSKVKRDAELLERMNHWLDTEKPYLASDFSIEQFADALGVSSHKLSAQINGYFGLRFTALTNQKRLAHAEQLLLNPEEQRTSIEAIALLSGFGSRSTFYEAFKNEYGTTPSEYRKIKLNKSVLDASSNIQAKINAENTGDTQHPNNPISSRQ